MLEERLNVRTRSIPTAAAIMVIGGYTPRAIRRRGGDITFEFAPEAEGALQQFLRAKAQLDRLVEEGDA
jgi:hypothetical protein